MLLADEEAADDMQPTYMESILSTPASSMARRAASVKIVRSDFSQSSPHLVMPTPMIATSLIARLLFRLPDLAAVLGVGAVFEVDLVRVEQRPGPGGQVPDLVDALRDAARRSASLPAPEP